MKMTSSSSEGEYQARWSKQWVEGDSVEGCAGKIEGCVKNWKNEVSVELEKNWMNWEKLRVSVEKT